MKSILFALLPLVLFANPIYLIPYRDTPRWDATYRGLSNPRRADHLLETQDYEEFLKLLWTEKNLDTRIEYLEGRLDNLHTLPFFELALAYIEKNPTLENYFLRAHPLYLIGVHRAELDAACSTSPSAQAAVEFLAAAYRHAIEEILLTKYEEEALTEERLTHYAENHRDPNPITRYLEPFLAPDKYILPSPNWLLDDTPKPKRTDRVRAQKARVLIDRYHSP